MKVRFCSSCGRLILADFLFCPYCGVESGAGTELSELLEEPFSRLESMEGGPASVERRIAELDARLRGLETEMEALLEAREGAGRLPAP